MPGVYKEKNCKYCNKLHRKRGLYCGQSCANRDRPEYSQKVSENMRKVANEYNQTPEAIAKQKQIGTSLAYLTAEDYTIDIPDLDRTIPDGYNEASDW